MKVTKEIFDEVNRLYNAVGNLSKNGIAYDTDATGTYEAYNRLVDEYDFASEIFRNEEGLEGLKLCTGEEVCPARYEKVRFFSSFPIPQDEFLTIASRNGCDFLVNYKGEEIFKSDEILPCMWGIGPVIFRKGSKWGMASSEGTILLEAKYDKVAPDVNGFIFLENEGKNGFVTPCGKAIEPVFDNIDIDEDDYLIVTLSDKRGYVNTEGNISEEITDESVNIDGYSC